MEKAVKKFSFLVAVFVAAAVCSAVRTDAQTAEEFRAEFHQTYPLAATGRINLKNVSGAVRIIAWDRNEVKLDAVKTAQSKESLDEAEIKVEATANAIQIRTSYPNDCCFYSEECCEKRFYRSRESRLAAVAYTLMVPRNARLESVEVIKGSVKIEGLSGSVNASTVIGDLDAKLTRIADSNSIALSSLTGAILLTIPSDSQAVVIARSLSSEITNDFGLTVNRGQYIGRNMAGRLGRGGARVTLDNIAGNISVRRLQDGRAQSVATNIDPQTVRTETEVNQTLARRIGARARQQAQQAVINSVDISQAMRDVRREVARAMRESLPIAVTIAVPQIVITPAAEASVSPPRPPRTPRSVRAPQPEASPTPPSMPTPAAPRAGPFYFRYNETESKSFTVSGVTRINLDTFDGPITVRAWDKQEVLITATKKARDEAAMRGARVRFEQRAGEVAAVARFDESSVELDSENAEVHLDAYVPRKANLWLATSGGRLFVEGVGGEMELRTDEGEIRVANGAGRLRANTSEGQVQITKFNGDVDARTNDGQILLEGRFNSLSARTGDGTITLSLPASFNATIETSAESIIIDGLSVVEEGDSSSRLRRWKLGAGGAVFSLRTGDGRVVLRRSGA
jgi:DUF4097 and DUF4098 domain-containing protein YvlB